MSTRSAVVTVPVVTLSTAAAWATVVPRPVIEASKLGDIVTRPLACAATSVPKSPPLPEIVVAAVALTTPEVLPSSVFRLAADTEASVTVTASSFRPEICADP